ncbi:MULTISPECIES: DNA polymerase III subunit epsilon [unclassified Methylophilus]|jgi:DNA polymerase III subunit epsilon|uniref:DNA polymerase III subunit epsilon n=1 Tax=Methylophilus glucosoxydans TaxID=752553 RepID=A0ABW3GLX5_9PROT|nr:MULTISPECIES: DNA polymerase III subunit epsilon [unclassified Methylophilus]MDF0376897.1 DNA polymerase III subunit epsilon [Methylophilus sp. YYY-1]MDT7849963.1 DNA polymerase III subunit epsilon [Methylophilus sp. VKM B-3414]
MRQIFLDTETTGLYPDQGHRIIEIAAVEMLNRRPTQRHFHLYINPEREIDAGAQEVHGISLEFLQDKPLFAQIAQDFIAFIRGAELIIHNAPFDVGFLNMELSRLSMDPLPSFVSGIVDTLKMAKEMRPGQRNNLDALCRHYGIDNSQRTLHGALLDAELLADVYIAMTRGQESLLMELSTSEQQTMQSHIEVDFSAMKRLPPSEEELASHQQYIESLSKSGASPW